MTIKGTALFVGAAAEAALSPDAMSITLLGSELSRQDSARCAFGVHWDGEFIAKGSLHAATHPLAYKGETAEIILQTSATAPAHPNWIAAVLTEICTYARHDLGLAALLAEPAEGPRNVHEALVVCGFVSSPDARVFRHELLSEFWRKRDIYIIAEAGSNWRMGTAARDLAMGKTLIDVASDAGADAIKFQTFRPETLYAANAGSSSYLAEAGISESMDTLFADITMDYEMLPALADHADKVGVSFMSTPFSAADFAVVDPLVQIHKIASYEISHIRLIELAARSGKPTVMSSGAATLDDIAWAVDYYHRCGGRDLCLLQCTASYPAANSALNLATIPELSRRLGVATGLSDHSRDPVVGPVVATALGARVIEKHFTLDNRLPGPDHAFAITAAELRELVASVRSASEALGARVKSVHPLEEELASFAQRGLQAIRPIKPGDTLAEDENVAILRPGNQPKGVHPRHIGEIEGRPATRALLPGEGLRAGDWQSGTS